MSRTSLFRWNRMLPLGFGLFAIAGLILVDSNVSNAQAKKEVKEAKADKEAKAEDGDAKAEKTETKAKAEVKFVPQIPPITDQLLNTNGAAQVAKINESIKANWIANKVNPSDRCTDYEFIRRASLDIIGRIATEKEIDAYMKQSSATRRAWLIENLLRDPEYGENFANIWTTLMLTRTGSKKMYQEQMREWLTEQLNAKEETSAAPATAPSNSQSKSKGGAPAPLPVVTTKGGADWSQIVTKILTATGKTNETAAVNFIATHIGDEIRQDDSKKGRASSEELQENGKYDMVPVTSRTTRLFLGVRTQCVQCHDHPFNGDLVQGQFWGINAFFRQTSVSQRPGMMAVNKKNKGMEDPQIELFDVSTYNDKGIVSYERRSGLLKYTSMQFLDGTRVKQIPSGSTRRAELAKLIVNNPNFSKAYVNRMWAHFFGKSFTKDAPDDFGEHNPATNPELLDYLADEFKSHGHNPKDLIRWICNSQAYGLSSKANKSNDKPDDEALFARMLLKSLTPEQLFESLMTATAAKIGDDKAAKRALREQWLDSLVLNFGNDEGEEGTFTGTVVQALMLMNGNDINQAISDEKVGTVAKVLGEQKFSDAAFNKLFLAALNRPPTSVELAKLKNPVMYNFHNPKTRVSNPAEFNRNYYQDVFWALLNSNEFILNH